ncbi:MAG: hypothetical protein ACRCZB_05460 [Bacteroidales bacterium]
MAEFELTPFALFGELRDNLKFRTISMDLPEFSQGEYEVHWKTQKFPKPNGKDETPKTFSTTFRVDKYYTTYKALLAWWQYICNSDTGAMAEDVGAVTGTSNIRTNIQARMVDSNGVTVSEGFKFEKSYLKSLTGFSYAVDSGDPLTCTCTWNYVKMLPIF